MCQVEHSQLMLDLISIVSRLAMMQCAVYIHVLLMQRNAGILTQHKYMKKRSRYVTSVSLSFFSHQIGARGAVPGIMLGQLLI